ncbi:MAG: shikimate kinase [Acetivibrionales bacterium]|jgi:shikimate kinase|nr:shikimate kinase [Bacillota bacterium]NLP08361.1 shikimate kinase [Clostridiaceae bacterium]HOA54665.1 shikimate kinase [Clostridiales bacterium]HPZ04842.1 shikimate kinase [Clostridiales bacterium]HQD30021.1 shikimate kinase [Clostridiales bacterium]
MAVDKNLVLIGMPGAGKSTVGVLLAKALKMPFTDTDILIQRQENSYLQELIEKHGIEGFIRIEENTVKSLDLRSHVIATGGSVVYSGPAMDHLKSHGIIFFLNARMYQLERRLKNARTRGIAMLPGQTLRSLYNERLPLYRKYADVEIDCSRKHIETIVSEIGEKFSDLTKKMYK